MCIVDNESQWCVQQRVSKQRAIHTPIALCMRALSFTVPTQLRGSKINQPCLLRVQHADSCGPPPRVAMHMGRHRRVLVLLKRRSEPDGSNRGSN